jgi:hypothetical protein
MVKLEVIGDGGRCSRTAPRRWKRRACLSSSCPTAWTSDLARKLEDVGCAAVMPLAAPIGSGLASGIIQPPDHHRAARFHHRRRRRGHRVRRGGRDGPGCHGVLMNRDRGRAILMMAEAMRDAIVADAGRSAAAFPASCAARRTGRRLIDSGAPAPRLYLITDRHATAGGPADVVAAALAGPGSGLPPGRRAAARRTSGRALTELGALRAVTAAGAPGSRQRPGRRRAGGGADGIHLAALPGRRRPRAHGPGSVSYEPAGWRPAAPRGDGCRSLLGNYDPRRNSSAIRRASARRRHRGDAGRIPIVAVGGSSRDTCALRRRAHGVAHPRGDGAGGPAAR